MVGAVLPTKCQNSARDTALLEARTLLVLGSILVNQRMGITCLDVLRAICFVIPLHMSACCQISRYAIDRVRTNECRCSTPRFGFLICTVGNVHKQWMLAFIPFLRIDPKGLEAILLELSNHPLRVQHGDLNPLSVSLCPPSTARQIWQMTSPPAPVDQHHFAAA